jgi:hypothetical protein
MITPVASASFPSTHRTVVLLIGAEPSPLQDESTYARPLTLVGNAARITGQSKFGSWSINFDGVGDAITTPNSPDLNLGVGDFTVEGWFRFGKITDQALLGQWDNNGIVANCSWYLLLIGGSLYFRIAWGSSITDVIASPTLVVGQWYHIAVDRSGTTIRIYVNGVPSGITTNVTQTLNDSSNVLTIGTIGTTGAYSAYDYQGQMDEIRITKSVARYDGVQFLPPSAPFPRSPEPLPIDTTGANLLVAWVVGWINWGTFTDSYKNVWTSLPQRTTGNNGGRWMYCTAPVVGPSHKFLLTGASYGAWIVHAFSGVNTFQAEVFAAGSGNITSLSSGSITPVSDESLILAAFTAGNPGTLTVAPDEFKGTLQQAGPTAEANIAALAYWLQPVAAPVSPLWSWPTAQFNLLASTIVFTSGIPTAQAQLSQLPVEVLVKLDPATVRVNLSQLPVEVLVGSGLPGANVSQVAVEVAYQPPPPVLQLSQVAVEVMLGTLPNLPLKLSQVAIEVLYFPRSTTGVVSAVWIGDSGGRIWVD